METTVVKGFKVLENLVASQGSLSLTEIASQCGISKSNAHRLLGTLEACGYVRRATDSRNYELTLRIWEMGQRVYSLVDLRTVAVPHLRALAAETEETVHLSVLDNNGVLYLDKVDSIHAVRTYVNVGDRAPAYCSATGKAMLAFSPDHVVEAVGATIEPITPLTVRSAAELRAHLDLIRERGFARTGGEWRPGVLGFAAPIKSPSGRLLGAIGVAGPEERMRQSEEALFVAALFRAVERIERDLGFSAETATAGDAAPPRKAPGRGGAAAGKRGAQGGPPG
ncbi:MAG: IclR family transcriptional regulator [Rhodobacteraceae bacterium]|jgi:IclR family KDG regulon transcriptional repressor|nr:IclR family transcriptional regulator [Paracoccaceae bacterium]